MKQKRFFLFAGDYYYPSGGMEDFDSSHDTRLEALQAGLSLLGDGKRGTADWVQVWDSEDHQGFYDRYHGRYIGDLRAAIEGIQTPPESEESNEDAVQLKPSIGKKRKKKS